MKRMMDVRILTLAITAALAGPALGQDGFEPFNARAFARFLGIGSGPGYHVYPCQKRQAYHFNQVVSGQTTPYARITHCRQRAPFPPVQPIQVGSAPGYSGCGCNHNAMGPGYGAGGYAGGGCAAGGGMGPHPSQNFAQPGMLEYGQPQGAGIVSPLEAEPQAPATLDGSIEPLPTKTPSTRAHQATTAPPEEATRAPAAAPAPVQTPPETGSPTQYNPLATPPPETDGLTPELKRELDLLNPEPSEDLPAPVTGSTDPTIWW